MSTYRRRSFALKCILPKLSKFGGFKTEEKPLIQPESTPNRPNTAACNQILVTSLEPLIYLFTSKTLHPFLRQAPGLLEQLELHARNKDTSKENLEHTLSGRVVDSWMPPLEGMQTWDQVIGLGVAKGVAKELVPIDRGLPRHAAPPGCLFLIQSGCIAACQEPTSFKELKTPFPATTPTLSLMQMTARRTPTTVQTALP
jgi:hypothetical protein